MTSCRMGAIIAGERDGFRMGRQANILLELWVDYLRSLTDFTTYSAADYHLYDLHRFMPSDGDGPLSSEGSPRPLRSETALLSTTPP